MKTRNYLSLIAACLLLPVIASGCSNDFSPSEEALPDAGVPVPISVEVASINAEVSTRAAIDKGNMGVYLASTNGYTPKYNAPYSYSGGKWTSASPINVGGQTASLYAYYPYDAALGTSAAGTSVPLTAQKYGADKALCYATSPVESAVKNTSPSVSFAMQHAYARLQFVITRNNSVDDAYNGGDCKVTKIELASTAGSIYTSGSLDMTKTLSAGAAPNPSVSGAAATYTFSTSGSILTSGIAAGATDSSTDYLFPPQTFSGDFNLSVSVDGLTLKATIPAASLPALTSGTITKININLQALKITVTVSSATIGSDYTNGGDITGGGEIPLS